MRTLAVWMVTVSACLGQGSGQDALWHHRNLGKAFYENPTTQKEAVEEFRKALALNPQSARERVNVGLALLKAGETKDAVAVLEAAQKQDPSIPHTWFNLGVVAKREGEYERALAQMQQMEKLTPEEPTVHHNLGAIYKLLNKPAEATREFEIAEKLNPNLAAPHFQLYNAYRPAGRSADAARELALFQEAKKRDAGAPIAENMEGNDYTEIYDTLDAAQPAVLAVSFNPQPLAKGQRGATVLGEKTIWWAAESISLPLPSGIHDIVNAIPGDFDNQGSPGLCLLTRTAASLYRNTGGKWTGAASFVTGGYRNALWIDFDHDYDLDLMLLGASSKLMRNNGDGTWTEQPFPFVEGDARAAKLFALRPETAARDFIVVYADRNAVLYRDDTNGKFTAVPLANVPAATEVTVADWDRDGTLDIAVKTSKGYLFFRNRSGQFEPFAVPAGASPLASFALGEWTKSDLPDLQGAVALDGNIVGLDGKGEIQIYKRGQSNEKVLRVAITGIKNIKVATGATVELKASALYQKQVYDGTPLFFSMRNYNEAETVRITWPNGLIQNEPQQKAGAKLSFKEAQRLSGSCPMIFTWDGERFRFITDVLGVAPLGASSGDGQYFPVNSTERIRIPGTSLKAVDGQYQIRITEELREVSYLDSVSLTAIDHAPGEVHSNDKFKAPPFPEHRLFFVNDKVYPKTARDGEGRDVRPELLAADRTYVKGFRHDTSGVADSHVLDLDFSGAALSGNAVLYLTGWVDWADGSTFLGVAQRKDGGLVFPYLQVKDAAGQWKTVIEDMGIPAGKPKTIAIDLSGKFLSASREVRIVTNLCLYWDEIYLGESRGLNVHATVLRPASAELRYRGFSKATIDTTREQPESFDYSRVLPLSSWNPTPGNYTRYGNVEELLRAPDDKLLVMGSGDEVELRFNAAVLPPVPEGWTRDYLLTVDGWAKDADANTAFGETVEPLPFRAMSAYPYKSAEHFPDDGAHSEYLRKYQTRPALRLIRPLPRKVTE